MLNLLKWLRNGLREKSKQRRVKWSKIMAISDQVEYSIKEAQDSLRNALAFAARSERPMVCKAIADTIASLENVVSVDSLLDNLDKHVEELKEQD